MLGCSGSLRPQETLISGWECQNDLEPQSDNFFFFSCPTPHVVQR